MHDVVNPAVIVAYLVAIAVIGLRISGHQRSATDYFAGERSLPWWAVMFSIVATETSTLTVISVPGVADGGSFSYVELAVLHDLPMGLSGLLDRFWAREPA